jgi:2-haloacid dehalogenase
MQRWATFDCYGTLIDWNGGIRAELARVFPDAVPVERADEPEGLAEPEAGDSEEAAQAPKKVAVKEGSELDRLLARYYEIEPELERDGRLSYREVMTEAMRRLGAPAGEEGGLAASLPGWETFPEISNALTEVRERGWKIAILSNSDRDLIEASKERIGVPFDETVVASEIHSYKPALTHWLEFYARTLADKRFHVHVAASSFHDIVPAGRLRIRSIWVNRDGEHPYATPTIELEDLYELGTVLDDLLPAA